MSDDAVLIVVGAGIVAAALVFILLDVSEGKALNHMQLKVFFLSLVLLSIAGVIVAVFL
ncbi:hypothetical protein KA529_02225 [Candidatus Saccharibacteria bacterium]|nr:hypothetical protein [Candidatus Saccharibacteria bacterium]